MPDFIFAFHGGKAPETQEAGQKAMAAWMASSCWAYCPLRSNSGTCMATSY